VGQLNRPYRTDFAALRFLIEMPDRQLQLFNVHLQTPRPGLEAFLNRQTGWSRAGVERLEGVQKLRSLESGQCSEWIASFKEPALIAGDFNMPVESTLYRRDWSRWSNAFSKRGWGLGFTKNSQKSGFSYGARIDHLLYSPPWRCQKIWVGPDIGSDHLPLFADFQLGSVP